MFEFNEVNNETGIEDIAKQVAVEGYCHVKNVISKEDAAKYSQEADRLLALQNIDMEKGIRQNYADYKCYQYSGDHLYNLSRKSSVFEPLLGHPFTVAVMDQVMGAKCILMQTELRRPVQGADKGGRGYQFHTDGRMPVQENFWIIAFWVFQDYTQANGATKVIPRTQFATEPVDVENAEKVTIMAKAGDLFFMNANLLHATGENLDGSSRWVMITTYNPWFIKPSVDHTKLFTREQFDRMTPELKQIYGFTSIPPWDERKRVYTCRPWEEMADEIQFADEPMFKEAQAIS